MEGTRLLNKVEKKTLNDIGRAYGVTFNGGSHDEATDTYWLGFDSTSATMSTAFSKRIKRELGAKRIVLNGPGPQIVV